MRHVTICSVKSRFRVSLSILSVSAAAGILASACSATPTVCAGVEYIRPTIPDTTTIKVGAVTIAIGGESYGSCHSEPARLYVWTSSDSTIASVAALDSIHAEIRGVRPGRAVITPAYLNPDGGDLLEPVRVTVVP